MIKAGDLRHRITIQERVKVSDNMGSYTIVYSDVVSVWAALWPVSAKEQISSDKIEMSTIRRIRIRYYSDLDSSMRIEFGTRHFNIVSIINPDEKNEMLDLICEEEV